MSEQRFERIGIHGFRRLENVQLELRPLTVLIGANGVGKTSLLDVFALLAASAAGGLNAALNDAGGLDAILTNGRASSLSFNLDLYLPNASPLQYCLSVGSRGVSYQLAEESLTQIREVGKNPFKYIDSKRDRIQYYDTEKKRLGPPTWSHSPTETSLSQVPKMFREPEEFRSRLASSTFYHALDVTERAPVRLPQPMRPTYLPGKNGEDLVSCLYSLRETDRDRFDSIEDALRAAFPSFERLDFPPVAAGTLALTWRDKNFARPMYMNQLSEGTLRFLWLATLLQSPGLSAVTLIDEPEVSLHPELLNLLTELMREASTRTQIIVATHSDRLVRFLDPKEVVVMDTLEDGSTSLSWADSLDLDSWLEDYTLDELWRNGRLGGRA